jgi:5-(carboxyamino)imidazole ribonucleotide mutase
MIQIILGSKSDLPVGKKATSILKQFDIEYKVSVASAHRAPEYLMDLIQKSDAEVFIAIAGLSAALPGAIAARTTKPVIGVPVSGKVNLDSILSTLQMPPGIPVATVGLDNGQNAALLAIQMLSLKDPELKKKLERHRDKLKEWMMEDNQNLKVEED